MLDSVSNQEVGYFLPKSFPHLLRNRHTKGNVLIIDEDHLFADLLKSKLEECGVSALATYEPFQSANLLADHRFDVVITDCALTGYDGVIPIENADQLIDIDPEVGDIWQDAEPTKVLFCSKMPIRLIDLRRANKLRHFNLVGFIPKIAGVESIVSSVLRHLNKEN